MLFQAFACFCRLCVLLPSGASVSLRMTVEVVPSRFVPSMGHRFDEALECDNQPCAITWEFQQIHPVRCEFCRTGHEQRTVRRQRAARLRVFSESDARFFDEWKASHLTLAAFAERSKIDFNEARRRVRRTRDHRNRNRAAPGFQGRW